MDNILSMDSSLHNKNYTGSIHPCSLTSSSSNPNSPSRQGHRMRMGRHTMNLAQTLMTMNSSDTMLSLDKTCCRSNRGSTHKTGQRNRNCNRARDSRTRNHPSRKYRSHIHCFGSWDLPAEYRFSHSMLDCSRIEKYRSYWNCMKTRSRRSFRLWSQTRCNSPTFREQPKAKVSKSPILFSWQSPHFFRREFSSLRLIPPDTVSDPRLVD